MIARCVREAVRANVARSSTGLRQKIFSSLPYEICPRPGGRRRCGSLDRLRRADGANGRDGLRFLGYAVNEGLVLWDLTRADKLAEIRPGLA